MMFRRIVVILTLVVLGFWIEGIRPAEARDPVMGDYTASPLYLMSSVPPNILIQLDTSGSMNSLAYGYHDTEAEGWAYHPDAFGDTAYGVATGGSDTTLVDDNASFTQARISPGDTIHNLSGRSLGVITGVADDHTLQIGGGMSGGHANGAGEIYWIEHEGLKSPDSPEEGYYGYFVPTARYRYVGVTSFQDVNGYFVRDDANGDWSGNFLNWLTMRRGDIAKKVLVGGHASGRDGDGSAVLVGEATPGTDLWWFPKFARDQEGYSPYTNRSFYTLREGYINVYTIEEGYPNFNYSHNFSHSEFPPQGFGANNFIVTDYRFGWNGRYEITFDIPYLTGIADNMRDGNLPDEPTCPAEMEFSSSYYYLFDPSQDFRGEVKVGDTMKLFDERGNSKGSAVVYHVPADGQDIIDTFRNLFPNEDCGLSLLHDMLHNNYGPDGWVRCEYYCEPDVDYRPCDLKKDWEACTYPWLGGEDRVRQAIEPLAGHLVIFDPNEIHFPSFPPMAGDSYEFSHGEPSIAKKTAVYRIAVERDMSGPDEAADFLNGDPAGVLQRFSSQVRFGFMRFNPDFGTGKTDGGQVLAPVGSDMEVIIDQIEAVEFLGATPVGETLYEASRYFEQNEQRAYYYGDYKIGLQDDGVQWDPFMYGDAAAWCLPSFVVQISDGEPVDDSDFESGWGIRDEEGDGYLDDVALYVHTTDLRPDEENFPGTQNLTYYSIFAFGQGSELLKDAARNGGFNDVNGDGLPEPPTGDADLIRQEWDRNQDGIPDNYFEAASGDQLESHLISTIQAMLEKAATGTAVTVLSTSKRGEGTVYQSYFVPAKREGFAQTRWLGFLHTLWVDEWGNLRLDTVPDGRLVLTEDKIARYYYDPGQGKTFVLTYSDANGDGVLDRPDQPDERIPLDPDEEIIQEIPSIWEAGKKLALTEPASRKIYTFADLNWDKVRDYSPEELVEFKTANLATFEKSLHVGSATYSFLDSSNGQPRAENLVNFIRGEAIPDLRSRRVTYGVSRAKLDWRLGDIVSSTPTVVGKPMESYHLIYGDTSYLDFLNQYQDRQAMIYMGANDGMLHAFRAGRFIAGDDPSTEEKEAGYFDPSEYSVLGTEAWAYVPFNLLPHLKWLADPDYAHVYYVDQWPRVADVKIFPDDLEHPNGWGTLLVGGMRLGGGAYTTTIDGTERTFRSGFFLIDVTDPTSGKPEVLAEFTHPDLGFTTSFPDIARVNDEWFLIVGSGVTDYVGGSSQTARLFVLNLTKFMQTRTIVENEDLFIIPLNDAKAYVANPISVDVDPNPLAVGKDYVDVIYVGDTFDTGVGSRVWNGKMYRLRTNGAADPRSWDVEVLLQTAQNQAISMAPAAAVGFNKELWVYFGTGRFFDVSDLTDTSVQTFYGVHDQCFDASANCSDPQNSRDRLLDVTAATVTAHTGDVSGIPDIPTFQQLQDLFTGDSPTRLGWKMDLLNSGERALNMPKVLGGTVFFTTFSPPTYDICSFGGGSKLYGLYFLTGTAHPKPTLGVTAEGEAAKSVSIGTGMPSGVGIHVGTREGATGFIQNSTGNISQEELTPPLRFKTGVTAWIQR